MDFGVFPLDISVLDRVFICVFIMEGSQEEHSGRLVITVSGQNATSVSYSHMYIILAGPVRLGPMAWQLSADMKVEQSGLSPLDKQPTLSIIIPCMEKPSNLRTPSKISLLNTWTRSR